MFFSFPVAIDFDDMNLVSAPMIKAKLKLEDAVLSSVCYPRRERKQCKDINEVRVNENEICDA